MIKREKCVTVYDWWSIKWNIQNNTKIFYFYSLSKQGDVTQEGQTPITAKDAWSLVTEHLDFKTSAWERSSILS